jgi:hypothetical protein
VVVVVVGWGGVGWVCLPLLGGHFWGIVVSLFVLCGVYECPGTCGVDHPPR